MNKFLIVFKDTQTGKLKNVSGTNKSIKERFPRLIDKGSFTETVLSVYNLTKERYVFKRRSTDRKANVLNGITQPPTVHNKDVGLGPYA